MMLISLTRKPAGSARKIARTAAALVTAAGLLSVTAAFAQDEDAPVKDDGLMGSLMRGMGATNGSNDIQYRERSPLVVPRQLSLPPPAERLPQAANWPKDPDVLERKAAREALAKRDRVKENDPYPLLPNELGPAAGQARARTATVAPQPGRDEERRIINEGNGILSPSQLGFTSGFLDMFSSKKDKEVPFTSEPSRDSLTQPPPGYQTPSTAHSYSAGDSKPEYGDSPDRQPQILPPGKF